MQVGNTTAFFQFPEFNSNTGCLPVIYNVSWIRFTPLNETYKVDEERKTITEVGSDGEYQVFAPKFDTEGTYELQIYSEAEGGASITTSMKTLELSCNETLVFEGVS